MAGGPAGAHVDEVGRHADGVGVGRARRDDDLARGAARQAAQLRRAGQQGQGPGLGSCTFSHIVPLQAHPFRCASGKN